MIPSLINALHIIDETGRTDIWTWTNGVDGIVTLRKVAPPEADKTIGETTEQTIDRLRAEIDCYRNNIDITYNEIEALQKKL